MGSLSRRTGADVAMVWLMVARSMSLGRAEAKMLRSRSWVRSGDRISGAGSLKTEGPRGLGTDGVTENGWRGGWRSYYVAPLGPYYLWGATARMLLGLAERFRS